MKDFAFSHLPQGYELYEIIDLAGTAGATSTANPPREHTNGSSQGSFAMDRNAVGSTAAKTAAASNAARNLAITGILLMAGMILWGIFAVKIPISEAFNLSPFRIVFAFLGMLMGLVVYIFVHEGVHGFFIKMFSGKAAFYGKNLRAGMFYAGSHCFFGKTAYVVIALAPFVIWGSILALLLGDLAVSAPQFWWYLYAIQIFNFTGAAGDLYMAWRTIRMPKGVLVQDDGTLMRFYAPKEQKSALN